jgi:hypothetical protein
MFGDDWRSLTVELGFLGVGTVLGHKNTLHRANRPTDFEVGWCVGLTDPNDHLVHIGSKGHSGTHINSVIVFWGLEYVANAYVAFSLGMCIGLEGQFPDQM